MSGQGEPSIIEYARFYDLIRDHLEDDPLQQFVAPHDILSDLEDGDLFQIRAENFKIPDERLTIDEGAASLLSSISALAQQPPSRHGEDYEIDTRKVQRMKQELPLLRSDPELDQLRFAPKIVPDLEHEFLPLETVDEEADEGLEWPTSCYDLPDQLHRKVKAEKLEVSNDALLFLQEALNFGLQDDEPAAFEDVELPYTTKTRIEPVSPPLLPMSPVALPFIPSSDTGRIELLSDHTSPTRDELREAERMIFADDAIVSTKKQPEVGSQNSDPMLLDSESLGDIYSPLKGIAERPSSSPTPRQSLQDRKVEVPLSPPTSEQPLPWKRKSVSFREALTDLIHDLPPPIPRPENVSSDDIDAIFEETIRPIGIKAERRVEQEQLQEADTTLRVPVPIMDFSLPIAPWKLAAQSSTTTSEETWKTLLSEMKDLHFSKHFWPLSGKVERELKWTPFPAALGKVGTQETISDDNFIEKYLAQPERVNIDTLTWKPEGLRILDDLAVSDEELEEGSFPEERDIDSLIRKRKYEFQADESSSPPLDDENEKAKARYRCDSKGQRQRQPIDHAGIMTGPFSALNALDTYMSVRKGEVEPPILTATKHFSNPSNENPTQPPPKATIPTNPPLLPQTPRSIPTPPLTIPSTPSPFVISASFLSNRKLTRQITHLYPSANLIERDFNLHLDTTPDPSTKPTTQSTISDEADILLSPSTGLIITTLQKIKQRSLPGQAARSAVRDRITRTSPRYERLIILVSEGRSLPDSVGNELDTSDCEALIELIAFCSTLQTDIQITFVAGGDEDVAKWIVALMVKYHVIDPELQLIQDETLWEVFLRRAGMNAFAAQVILAGLKAPTANEDDLNGNGEGVCGLTAFVKMGIGERAARFERVLGGREVLGRVSRVLDARW